MRVDLLTPLVQLRAEQRGAVTIEIRNDSDVIERIVCTVPRLDGSWYEVSPLALTLFPGDSGEVQLNLLLPRSFPAGTHELQVAVEGRVGGQTVLQRILIEVAPTFDMVMSVNPQIVTAKRRAWFYVTLRNRGNAATDMIVRVSDDDGALALEVEPPLLNVAPGAQETARVTARGRRPWFGSPVSYTLQVSAEQTPEVLTDRATLKLRPRLTAGMITALMLATVVAVWAVALLVSANSAFGSSPPKKTLAQNFSKGVAVGALDPTQVGASLAGTVTAQSNGAPLARITIELYDTRDTFVTAVATGPDGGYKLGGVLPGRYRLRFRAPGYDDRWYPAALSAADAQVLQVSPKKAIDGLNLALPGGSGVLTATVIAADGSPVAVQVSALAIDVPGAKPITKQAVGGKPFTIEGLPTPATYRITATAPNFQEAEVTQALTAGQKVTANPIQLSAAPATISGKVVDLAGVALGDVTITTTVNGKPVSTVTPTSGPVGTFSFTNLPTPGTYVLELTHTGAAKVVTAVKLDAGQSMTQTITMGSATGTLTGVVTADGAGLGGATVQVSGGGFNSTASTFTSNPPGSYLVTGLPVPGTYVVTVTAPGKLASSVSVTLTPEAASATVDTTMLSAVGRVYGKVTLNGNLVGGANVSVSDGNTVVSTVSATVGNIGSFEV
ncbi:MAG: carboxypeptidase-like regulatory domain-containing protein, partial [Ilumatobacteraceae bacterium]